MRARLLEDCHLLFCQEIGGPAAARLIRHQIHPMKAPPGTTIQAQCDAVSAMLAGRLPPWLAKRLNRDNPLADPAGLFLPPQGTFFQQGKRRRTGTKVTAGGWAHQENWRERRRASRTGRQDGGQRAVETRMSSPPVPPDEAGVERTAQRQFSAPCWGSWGAGETPPMPFTRRGRNEIVRKVGERNIPPYRPFPSFANMRQYCRGKSSYQRDKSCLPPV